MGHARKIGSAPIGAKLPVHSTATGQAESGPPRGPSKNARRRVAELERQIQDAERALAAMEEELSDPVAWSDPDRAGESVARHDSARRTVEELYARLETALG